MWCGQAGGKMEHRLPDGARVDCLTGAYAVEFDFADKWAESVGQALHYAEATGREAGVVLILEQPADDAKYVERLRSALRHAGCPATIWLVGPDGETME
jgi:predicted protein tyrosine phosphatase